MKICVFTGTRADYGILYPVMNALQQDSDFSLSVLVSGMHLSPEFGLTYKAIVNDGFDLTEKVEMLVSSDSPQSIVKSMGLGMIGYSDALTRIAPDLIMILGDRFEGLAVASSAMVLRIPIAHLHGGEATFGLIDEPIRHSITKMSHLHFTSTDAYRKRVIQLGEHPNRVFNVGAPGIDNIVNMELMEKNALEEDLKFRFEKKNLLCTFHPVTLEKQTAKYQIEMILKSLEHFEDINIIFTKANADTEGRIINDMIDQFVSRNQDRAAVFASLGQRRYLSVMNFVDGIIGNSSSGIIEAPSFKIGTINVGERQNGRVRAESNIDCDPTIESITMAIEKLYSDNFQEMLKNVENPYGKGDATSKIINVLRRFDLKDIIKKEFYNLYFDVKH